MKISLIIENSDIENQIENALHSEIKKEVEPKVAEMLKRNINTDNIVRILEKKIQDTISYSRFSHDRCVDEGSIAYILEEKLSELVKNISDEELKNYLLDILIRKVNKC